MGSQSHKQLSDWTTTWFGNMYNFVQTQNNLDKEKKRREKKKGKKKRKDEAEEKKKQRSISQN